MAYIYLISNDINNNVYVGKTVATISERYSKHISEAFTKLSDYAIHRAMRKYGIEHFTIKEIEKCSYQNLSDREIYWISYYDSYNNGYNETLGGEGNLKYDYDYIYQLFLSGLTQKEIAQQIGCEKHTITRALKNCGVNENDRQKGKYGNSKKIVQKIDLLTGQVIKEYSSATLAAKEEGCSIPTMSMVCHNKRKLANRNYTYKYKETEEKI